VEDERVGREVVGIESGDTNAGAGVVPLLLTIPQAALVLAVGRTTVYELIGAGDLEAVHIGRSVRVPVDALRSFVDRRRLSHPSATVAAALRASSPRDRSRLTSRRK
jgi:excisionase family DNA binding protein